MSTRNPRSKELYAVRTPKENTGKILKKVKEKGIYDDSRSIKRVGEFTEIPIDKPIDKYKVVKQTDPKWRKKRPPKEAPSSWKIIGDIILVRLEGRKEEKKEEIAEHLLEIHSNCHTVLDYRGVKGKMREPIIEKKLGLGKTETVHSENGFSFKLDTSKVMFSKGNEAERLKIKDMVKEGEKVFDMFAGIGQFSIPAAKGGGKVKATEINPIACKYLEENANLNNVNIDTYNKSCEDLNFKADRIIMGHFDCFNYLNHAFKCLENLGNLHLHCLEKPKNKKNILNKFKKFIRKRGEIINSELREVKTYSKGISHIVMDVKVKKLNTKYGYRHR